MKTTIGSSKADVDVDWHKAKASEAYSDGNHFASAFHYQRLLENDPESVEFQSRLFQSRLDASKKGLNANSEEIDALSNIKDATGTHHGTFYGSERKHVVTTYNEGPFEDSDQALFLDGESFVNLDNADFYQSSFTAEGWIKPAAGQMNSQSPDSSLAVFTLLNTKNEADTALSALVLPDGRFRVNFRNPPGFAGGIDIYSDTKLTDGQWHHFAIVNDNDHKLRLYIDGDEEAISDVSTSDMEDLLRPTILNFKVASTTNELNENVERDQQVLLD